MAEPFKMQSPNDVTRAEALRLAEPKLVRFTQLARARVEAREVWLSRSRARGDNHPSSNWDLLVVLDDEAPGSYGDTGTLCQLGRNAGLSADVVSVRASEAWAARNILTTLMYEVGREGIRVDA